MALEDQNWGPLIYTFHFWLRKPILLLSLQPIPPLFHSSVAKFHTEVTQLCNDVLCSGQFVGLWEAVYNLRSVPESKWNLLNIYSDVSFAIPPGGHTKWETTWDHLLHGLFQIWWELGELLPDFRIQVNLFLNRLYSSSVSYYIFIVSLIPLMSSESGLLVTIGTLSDLDLQPCLKNLS